jgi:cytochrome c-type biogenesis protein
MILGFGPSGELALYLTLGMVAAVNPCGVALLPAYLSYFLGVDSASQTELAPDGSNPVAAPEGFAGPRPSGAGSGSVAVAAPEGFAGPRPSGAGSQVALALRVSLAVSAGFLAVFAVAGMAVRHTSLPVYEYVPWISLVIGLALIGLGIAMLFGFQLVVNLPKLNRGGRQRTLRSMFLFGASYAVASIGCTLPIFLAAVAGTMARDSLIDGLIVFGIYGLGIGLVLGALTVSLALARHSVVNAFRASRAYINGIAGALIVTAGAYVIYYGALELRTYRASGGAIPSSSVINTVSGWSYDVQNWIESTGSVLVAVVLAAIIATAAVLSFRAGRSRVRPDDAPGRPSGSAVEGEVPRTRSAGVR